MNETDVTPHNYYFLQATEDELRELLLLIDQSGDRAYNWESLDLYSYNESQVFMYLTWVESAWTEVTPRVVYWKI